MYVDIVISNVLNLNKHFFFSFLFSFIILYPSMMIDADEWLSGLRASCVSSGASTECFLSTSNCGDFSIK